MTQIKPVKVQPLLDFIIKYLAQYSIWKLILLANEYVELFIIVNPVGVCRVIWRHLRPRISKYLNTKCLGDT